MSEGKQTADPVADDRPVASETPAIPPPVARRRFGFRVGSRAAGALASKAFPLVCIAFGLAVVGVRIGAPWLEPVALFVVFALAVAMLLVVGHFFIRPVSELLGKASGPGASGARRGLRDPLTAVERTIEKHEFVIAELSVQRDRYRDLVEGVDAILWEADPETWQYRYVSRGAEAILGFPRNRWIDEPPFWAERLHPEDRFTAVRRSLQPLSRAEYHTFEYRMIAADGRSVWLRDVFHLAGPADAPLVRGIMLDITERAQAERSLRESEARFRSVVEDHPGMLMLFDRERRVRYLNANALLTLGRSPDDVIGRRCEDFLPAQTARFFATAMENAFEKRRPQNLVCPAEFPGGRVDISGTYVPLLDASGEVHEMLAVAMDVSELRESERALKRERDRAEQYLEMSGTIFIALDLEGRITLANQTAYNVLGYEPGQLYGKHWISTCVPPELRETLTAIHRDLVRTGGSEEGFESPVQTKSGERRVILWRMTVVRDDLGHVSGLLSAGLDVTDRIRAENELREADRERAKTLSILQGTLEATADGLLVVGLDGRFQAYNENFLTMWGIPSRLMQQADDDAALAHVLSQLADPEGFLARVKELYATPETVCTDLIEFKDGRVFERHSRPHVVEGRIAGRVWGFRDRTLAVRTERELRDSREYLSAVMQNSSDLISVLSEDTIIRHVSGGVERILGFRPEELLGRSAFDIVFPEDRPEAEKLLGRLLSATGSELDFRIRAQHRNGDVRLIEGIGRDLRGNPSIRGILINARDVTDEEYARKVADVLARILQAVNETDNLTELIRYSRDQISALMDVTNFYVALYDEARELYSFPFVADEVEQEAEFPPQAMRRSLTDYVRRQGRAMLVDEALQHDLEASGEIDQVGEWSAIWMGAPLRTSGAVFGVIALQSYTNPNLYTERDLSLLQHIAERIALAIERKRMMEARHRLAAAVDQIKEMIVITDCNGVIQYVNPAFEQITGFAGTEAIGQTPRILSSGHHPREFYAELWETLLSGQAWRGRFVNKRKDGTIYTEDAAITPVHDSGGRLVNFVAIKRDITEDLRMEAQLRQSQKLESVGSLAAGIAHEINTPIQFVGDNVRFMRDSFTDLLALVDRMAELLKVISESGGPVAESVTPDSAMDVQYIRDEVPRAIEQTLEGVERITTIVRAMKDFSHPDPVSKMPADLNRALASTLTVTRNEYKYIADLETDFDESIPSVWCHLGELNQAFLNIIVNAAHAIADAPKEGRPERGLITVRTRRVPEGVMVSISDSGPGIPEDVRDRIFEPFFTTKEVGRGTGQGLAISRSVIVGKHGGQLTFETEAGKGTTFHILLPTNVPVEAETVPMVGTA